MITGKIKHTLIWMGLAAYVLGISPGVALAATAPSSNPANNGQALEIAPPIDYLTVSPGETLNTQIYIRDISSGDLIVSGQVNDFISDGLDGTPKILLNANDNDPYSLRSWITLTPSILLIPQQIKSMPVTISVPSNASPGGHYGVVRFTATPPSLANSGVSLSASIGALFLVTVTGNIQENLAVQSFTVNHSGKNGTFFEAAPLNFVELFKNDGNIHLQPSGQINIYDTFGRKLANLNVNVPPDNVLPDSTRRFSEALDSSVIGNKMLFGRYRAVLKVTYGTSKKALTTTIVFWVIPYKLVAVIVLALIIGFLLLRYGLRRYNRHILAQAQRPHTPKHPPQNRQ